MQHAPFILAAYAITVAGLGTMLLVTWRRLRRAERTAQPPAERR